METITKKLVVFGLIGTLGFSLPGCGSTTSEYSDDDNVAVETDSTDDEKASETKYFDVGEHLYFERYYLGRTIYAENITGGSVSIPEGYSVYDIENFNEESGRGSQTGGYDVWFVNDVPVEVEKVYNEIADIYDYSEPGTPVLEKSEDSVQKVK